MGGGGGLSLPRAPGVQETGQGGLSQRPSSHPQPLHADPAAWAWEHDHLRKEGHHLSDAITRPDGHFPGSRWQRGCPAARATWPGETLLPKRVGGGLLGRPEAALAETPALPASLFGDSGQSEKR